MIFFSGYLSAKLKAPLFRKKEHSKEYNAISKAQSPKELLFSLINLHKEKIFTNEVQLLEEILYKNASHNFNDIKKKILKKV